MVILDIKGYTDEANRQLNNTNNYEQLDFDSTELHREKIKSEINTLKKGKPLDLKNSKLPFRRENKNMWVSPFPRIHNASNPERCN